MQPITIPWQANEKELGIVMVPSGVKSPHVTVLLWPTKVLRMVLRSAFHIHMLQSSDTAIIKFPRECHLSHYRSSCKDVFCDVKTRVSQHKQVVTWMKQTRNISPRNLIQSPQVSPEEFVWLYSTHLSAHQNFHMPINFHRNWKLLYWLCHCVLY
jgi:hypothetical protein